MYLFIRIYMNVYGCIFICLKQKTFDLKKLTTLQHGARKILILIQISCKLIIFLYMKLTENNDTNKSVLN